MMNTNRTKIDWAYKQAQKIARMVASATIKHTPVEMRKIAAILRRAEMRGCRNCWFQTALAELQEHRPLPVRAGKTYQLYEYNAPERSAF